MIGLYVLTLLFIVHARGEQNIGCLFSPVLCEEQLEWCYDDHAFGRCLPQFQPRDAEDMFQYDLDQNDLSDLEVDLQRLFTLGYRWSHPFTQCILKAQLDSFRYRGVFGEESCSQWESLILPEVAQQLVVDDDDVAFVSYQPSAGNPHADFADEVYFPPSDETSAPVGRAVNKKSLPPAAIFSPLYNTPRMLHSNDVSAPHGQHVSRHPEYDEVPSDDDRVSEITLARLLKQQSGSQQYQQRGDSNELPPAPVMRSRLDKLASLFYQDPGAAYTEGGLVFLPNQPDQGDAEPDLEDTFLGLGFKRPERLDVKKPGPQFTVMNLAEQQKAAEQDMAATPINKTLPAVPTNQMVSRAAQQQIALATSNQQQTASNMQMWKKTPGDVSRPTPDAAQYEVVDTTFAYIGFKQSIKSWHEGRNIVRVVAELLGLPPGTLSHSRVDRNEVTFRVEPNNMRMNSSEVAKRVEGIKDELKRRTGVEVTSAGIGDKTKLPTVLSLAASPGDYELWLSVALLSGVVGSVGIAAVTLICLRHNAKTREKLAGLAGPDTEAVGDYQDLCRARMAGKPANEKPEPIGHRIASLSRESESNNSPSSRSSTSSWSEEPALTNMDISTGHMVLSYMEDHLLNKDRLEQEWVALCAYEAEPCATVHALKPDNLSKNRYAEVVPYDHSRVVLNDLANISGADYINASTITDHDPRSPAYIATQGPLPQTAPHFWQLVWEQGSVVMVMLTRLTEHGQAMCHRYWPEEGSELYHIYEVHLVSEHIWCDDYLVRSFYLKNLKTGETRTVTQFHFLSWPDNGVPTSTKALLEFRRKVNKSYRGRSCPIVVHCSDGVGRTGTYCLIDMVLNRMAKGAKEIDIAATLEHIRDQRAGMVKTKEQFELVLKAVAEEVNAILKALPPQQSQPAVTPPVGQ